MNSYYKDIKAKAMTQITHWYDGVIIAWHWNISFMITPTITAGCGDYPFVALSITLCSIGFC